jgi:hypothetical protein
MTDFQIFIAGMILVCLASAAVFIVVLKKIFGSDCGEDEIDKK